MHAGRPLNYRTYSRFARDPDVFLYLVDSVLFTLARQAVDRGESVLRVWSLGCAAGEEPFSIAIAWVCALAAEYPNLHVQIWGTDVDSNSLERARAGVFDSHAVANLPVEWLARCFEVKVRDTDKKSVYVLSNELRKSVTFAKADAQFDPPPEGGPFSLILCRYSLFLYLPSSSCWTIVQRIVAPTVLCHKGYLVTGVTDRMPQGIESLGLIALTRAPNGIYRIERRNGRCPLDDKPGDLSFDTFVPKTLSELLESKQDTLSLKQEATMPPSFVSSHSRKLLKAHARSGALTIKEAEERPHLPEASPAAKKSDRTSRRQRNGQPPARIGHELQRHNTRAPCDERTAVSTQICIKRRQPGGIQIAPVCEIRSRHEERDVAHRKRSANSIPRAAVDNRTAVPLRSKSMSAQKHILSEAQTELLIERLMTDVVRRQQRLTSMRANQELALSWHGSSANKLSRKALLNFLTRVAADVEKRKQSLAQLQLDLVASSVSWPASTNERRQQEQHGLVGLKCIAERATTTNSIMSLAVNPNRLIRFMLRTTSLGPVASTKPCSLVSADTRDVHDATIKPRASHDCHTQFEAPRRSIVLSSMTTPHALAMRTPVPDQTSMLKRSLKLGVASVGLATACR